MSNSKFEAQVSILASAVEHDRRHDSTARDQAVNEAATPRQAKIFWERIERGDSPQSAARAALGSRAY